MPTFGTIFHRGPEEKNPAQTKLGYQNKQKLGLLVKRSDDVLFVAESIFPFDFFPDSILVDQNKVDIVTRNFFYSEQIYSVLIQDINSVHVEKSLFFSQIMIEVAGFRTHPPPVNYIKNEEALRAKRIILGLVTAAKQRLSLQDLSKEEILGMVEQIGSTAIPMEQYMRS